MLIRHISKKYPISIGIQYRYYKDTTCDLKHSCFPNVILLFCFVEDIICTKKMVRRLEAMLCQHKTLGGHENSAHSGVCHLGTWSFIPNTGYLA